VTTPFKEVFPDGAVSAHANKGIKQISISIIFFRITVIIEFIKMGGEVIIAYNDSYYSPSLEYEYTALMTNNK
jgi:hypothetical protein